jgi:glycosyltransferase involved in cell wall biosynthesis
MSLIYDLIPEVFGFNRMNRGWMERELAINASSSFFSISQNSKKDLHKFYPHTQELLTGIGYPGIDVEMFSQRKVFSKKNDNSEKRYFVCVGSRYGESGYKNGKLLVDAINLLDSSKMNFNLYFVGGEPLTEEEIKLQKRKGLQIFTGRLNDEELVSVISNAEALIYPSKYEGFGMPPLEALALGTPVIVTKNSSILESVGDLGIFVEENEPYKLAEILGDTDFGKVREEIKIDGPKRALSFSWERTANDFGKVLHQTLTTPQSDSVLRRKKMLSEYSEIAINLQR